MTNSVRLTLVFLAILLMASALGPLYVVAATQVEARLAITAAQDKIVISYQAVAEADKAGANVTDLLKVLDAAGMLLSKANWEYSRGDFDSAFNFANESQNALNGMVEEANVLRDVALQDGYWDFIVNVVESVVGAISIVFGGFAVWFYLKKRYGGAEGVT